MRLKCFLAIISLCISASATFAKPKFVTHHLAGRHLLKAPSQRKFDPKSKYYLVVEQDEQYRRVVLVPNLQMAGFDSEDPKDIRAAERGCPRGPLTLRTGAAIRVGFSPRQVRNKLGTPTTNSKWDDKQRNTRVYTYTYNYRVCKQKRRYEANYTFQGQSEKLVAIEFIDYVPESLS